MLKKLFFKNLNWRYLDIFARVLTLLDSKHRLRIVWIIITQFILGFLDLVGVFLIGIIGSLAILGVSGRQPGSKVSYIFSILGIADDSLQSKVTAIGTIAVILLVCKTIFSSLLSRYTLLLLSKRAAFVSQELITRLLKQDIIFLKSRSAQETIYSVTNGVSTLIIQMIGYSISLMADMFLLCILIGGLFFVDISITFSTLIFYSIVGITMYKSTHGTMSKLSAKDTALTIASNEKINEIINAYREIHVYGRKAFYANKIGSLRLELARNTAKFSFIPNVSKYVIEISVVLGAFILSAFEFKTQTASHAVSVLSIFLMASTRIAPAVLRMQQGLIMIKSNFSSALPTLDLINLLDKSNNYLISATEKRGKSANVFIPNVEFDSVTIKYEGNEKFEISNFSLSIKAGEFVAIVGPSASGKSTIIDAMLGIVPLSKGSIFINGLKPLDAIQNWPGAISYVPQSSFISSCSVRENIALGLNEEDIDTQKVRDALSNVGLLNQIMDLPKGIDTLIGESGIKLSGGQNQRISIARAIYNDPNILILDEATSALDAESEFEIMKFIQNRRNKITIIMIAHRLSTILEADRILYLEQGKVRGYGNLQTIRDEVPEFEKQLKIMGVLNR